jgi:hypothetical protein
MIAGSLCDQPVAPLSKPPLTRPLGAGGGGVVVPPDSGVVWSRTFGEPPPGPVTRPVVPAETRALRTAAGVAVRLALRCSAAAPATCGVAMDVPLIVLVAVVPVCQADVMLEPGANRSRHVP